MVGVEQLFTDKKFPQEDFITLRISDLSRFLTHLRARIKVHPKAAIDFVDQFEYRVLTQFVHCSICTHIVKRSMTMLGVCPQCLTKHESPEKKYNG